MNLLTEMEQVAWTANLAGMFGQGVPNNYKVN